MSVIFDGLSLGAIYALIALGYTMVYGIAKMLNFAHGDIIMVGAYAVFTTLAAGGNLAIGVLASVIVCTLMGIIIEKVAYRPLRGVTPIAVLITAIGVSYLLQSIAQLIFGAKAQSVSLPSLGAVNIAGTNVSVSSILTMGISAVIMIALTLFIKKTRTGRAMLAVSEDRGAAQLMGINVNKIITVTFAIGSALAAFASVFYLFQIPTAEPTLIASHMGQINFFIGFLAGMKAFVAAVLGGIGSIPGAMIGGVLLGVIEKICLAVPVLAPYTTAVEFSLLILILLVRPIGLLGKKRREKV